MTILGVITQKDIDQAKELEAKIFDAMREWGMDPRLLSSKSRTRDISDARSIYVNLMYNHTWLTMEKIGEWLNMTKQSVWESYTRSRNLYEWTESYRQFVDFISMKTGISFTRSYYKCKPTSLPKEYRIE